MSRRRPTTWILPVLGVAASLVLVHYAYWLHLIHQANAALRDESQLALAADRYEAAVAWTPPLVGRIPVVRNPLRYALLKQAQILHLERKPNDALVFLQGVRPQHPFMEREPEYHLWHGDALFVRAIFQEDPQAMVNDLQAATRAYQTSLELDPSSWDARYNYEFIKRALIAEGEQGHQRLKLLLEEKERPRRNDELPPGKVG
jgi:hypothetical protein